jgi:hypothetical protein
VETDRQERRRDDGKGSEQEQGLHAFQSMQAIAYPERSENDIEECAKRQTPGSEGWTSNG